MLFVNCDNVTSKQFCTLRKKLREMDATMVMGKNTLLRKALDSVIDTADRNDPKFANHRIIHSKLVQNTGLIFTDGDLKAVKDVLDAESRQAPAQAGMIAPKDVMVHAGPTGLDPKQTTFF